MSSSSARSMPSAAPPAGAPAPGPKPAPWPAGPAAARPSAPGRAPAAAPAAAGPAGLSCRDGAGPAPAGRGAPARPRAHCSTSPQTAARKTRSAALSLRAASCHRAPPSRRMWPAAGGSTGACRDTARVLAACRVSRGVRCSRRITARGLAGLRCSAVRGCRTYRSGGPA